MNERERAITNLMAVDLSGGSHEMLSSIAKAIYKPTCGGWTIGACQVLRDTLVNLLSETDEEALREAYTKGRNDGFDRGFASADDWCAQHEDAMAEHGWVRLPKDADGEPIHIGDELRDEWHEQNQGEVEWLMLDHHGWWLMFKNNCERFYLHEFHEWHHHHAPTVEDTLHELIGKALTVMEINGENELVAEYAKRLTLRGDGE